MGLVSHEAPRLTATGPVPYPNDHGPLPLEEGMVLSVETTLLLSVDEAMEAMRRAQQVRYRPPGV